MGEVRFAPTQHLGVRFTVESGSLTPAFTLNKTILQYYILNVNMFGAPNPIRTDGVRVLQTLALGLSATGA